MLCKINVCMRSQPMDSSLEVYVCVWSYNSGATAWTPLGVAQDNYSSCVARRSQKFRHPYRDLCVAVKAGESPTLGVVLSPPASRLCGASAIALYFLWYLALVRASLVSVWEVLWSCVLTETSGTGKEGRSMSSCALWVHLWTGIESVSPWTL